MDGELARGFQLDQRHRQADDMGIRAGALFPGEPRIGAPDPGDPMAAIALSRRGATTNAQDIAAQDAAWNQRRSPICEQKRERPPGFRANFFK